MKKRNPNQAKALAQTLNDRWCELEEEMGEMAALNVACEEMGLSYEEGLDLITEYCAVDAEA